MNEHEHLVTERILYGMGVHQQKLYVTLNAQGIVFTVNFDKDMTRKIKDLLNNEEMHDLR